MIGGVDVDGLITAIAVLCFIGACMTSSRR